MNRNQLVVIACSALFIAFILMLPTLFPTPHYFPELARNYSDGHGVFIYERIGLTNSFNHPVGRLLITAVVIMTVVLVALLRKRK
jgi:hypothetical protein